MTRYLISQSAYLGSNLTIILTGKKLSHVCQQSNRDSQITHLKEKLNGQQSKCIFSTKSSVLIKYSIIFAASTQQTRYTLTHSPHEKCTIIKPFHFTDFSRRKLQTSTPVRMYEVRS